MECGGGRDGWSGEEYCSTQQATAHMHIHELLSIAQRIRSDPMAGCEIEAKPRLHASNGSPSGSTDVRPSQRPSRISQRLYRSVNGSTAESAAVPLSARCCGLVNGSTVQSTALRLSQRPYSSVNGRTLSVRVSFEIKFERQKKVFAIYERGELLRRLRTPRFVGSVACCRGAEGGNCVIGSGEPFPRTPVKTESEDFKSSQ